MCVALLNLHFFSLYIFFSIHSRKAHISALLEIYFTLTANSRNSPLGNAAGKVSADFLLRSPLPRQSLWGKRSHFTTDNTSWGCGERAECRKRRAKQLDELQHYLIWRWERCSSRGAAEHTAWSAGFSPSHLRVGGPDRTPTTRRRFMS